MPVRALLAGLALVVPASAQDLEPRRWTHLPVGTNVVGLSYVRIDGDLNFDPVLQISDASVAVDTLAASYAHAFDLLGKTARVDVVLPYQHATWDGLLAGAPASVTREGFGDPPAVDRFNDVE